MSEPLGPALTPEFPGAVGLDDLASVTAKRTASAPAAAAPDTLPKDVYRNLVDSFDRLVSGLLGTEQESSEQLEALSEGTHPLAQHYMPKDGEPSVMVIHVMAGVALVAYVGAKYQALKDIQQEGLTDGDQEEDSQKDSRE